MGVEDQAVRVSSEITARVSHDPHEVSVDPEPTVVFEETETAPVVEEHHRFVELGGVTSSNFFQHPLTHPRALDLALTRAYGSEWVEWNPETVIMHLGEHGTVSWNTFQKVSAVQALHQSNAFSQRWETFLWLTMALNGIEPDFDNMQVPVTPQCGLSVSVANSIAQQLWSGEVIDYIATVHRHDGLWTAVAPLDFVKLDRPTDFVDFAQVDMLWPRVKAAKLAPAGDTPEAIQLQRMLTCYEYVDDWNKRLVEQEKLVANAIKPRR